MSRLSHIAPDGSAQMVDVSAKPISAREATAAGRISLRPETLALISENKIAKGNVFATRADCRLPGGEADVAVDSALSQFEPQPPGGSDFA
jgi:hypothetical protein